MIVSAEESVSYPKVLNDVGASKGLFIFPKLLDHGLSDRQIRLALGNAMNYAMFARLIDEVIAMLRL